MKKRIAVVVLGSLVFPPFALAQGAADRVDSRVDSTWAKTQDRLNTVKSDQTTQETIVKEQVIIKQVNKGAVQRGLLTGQAVKPQMKRYVIRRTETIQRSAPLRINPF
jgi:hypothetical protein